MAVRAKGICQGVLTGNDSGQDIMQQGAKGIILAFVTVLLWSTNGVSLKLLVRGMDDFSVALYTGLASTLIMYLYLAVAKKVQKVGQLFKKHPFFFISAGIIGLGAQQLLYIKGFSLLPASQVVILFYLYPLLMVLISWLFFKSKISLRSFFFICLGFIGVVILISKGTFMQLNVSQGVIVTFFAALTWAIFSVMIKNKKFDADIGMFLFNLFGFISLAALTPFYGLSFNIHPPAIAGIAYVALFPTAAAFVFWNKALHMADVALCSNIALITPLLSVVWIYLILGEKLVLSQIIGIILIAGSVFLNLTRERVKSFQK
ncbi:MAG: DMT family transporter [Syntrophales bacterium]|nr:DMT family transporter [Syntrophales bacterium]